MTYSGGYRPAEVPDDIKNALIIQIRYFLQRWNTDKLHLKTEGFDKVSTSYMLEDLHPVFTRVIGAYMRYD